MNGINIHIALPKSEFETALERAFSLGYAHGLNLTTQTQTDARVDFITLRDNLLLTKELPLGTIIVKPVTNLHKAVFMAKAEGLAC